MVNVASSGLSDVDWCRTVLEHAGVGCLPMRAFYSDQDSCPKHLVRIAICKTPETVREAVERLRAAASHIGARAAAGS